MRNLFGVMLVIVFFILTLACSALQCAERIDCEDKGGLYERTSSYDSWPSCTIPP